MIELGVWIYPTVDGGRRLERRLSESSTSDAVVMDGAVVVWLPGNAAPFVRDIRGVLPARGLGAGFWGLLFGIVAAGPCLNRLIGESGTVLDGALSGVGIDAGVVGDLRGALQPGSSAVALIGDESLSASTERLARLLPAASPWPRSTVPHRTRTRLSADHAATLRWVFAT